MPQPVRWLKSQPVILSFEEGQIDAENGIIRDVVMCQAGPAKGHGVHLEESFVEQLVAYDHKNYSEGNGLKARFGHPALSDTTMGSQMGYFRNQRYKDGKAIADLHLLDSAELSPKAPQMRSWMLSMAQEANDFVMSSIVFQPSGYYQYDPETGARVELETSSWGQPRVQYDGERVYVDFNEEKGARHYYTDLVEAGAATNSLFSQEFNRDKFAVRTIEWLQENEDILSFIKQEPGKIVEMCEKLGVDLPKPKITFGDKITALKNWLNGQDEPAQNWEEQLQSLTAEHDKALSELRSAHQEELTALEAKHTALVEQKDAEIKALKKKHLAAITEYEGTQPHTSDNPLICELTRKAMKKTKK
jgi:hypothetical protein